MTQSKRTRLIAGNWKMNNTIAEAVVLTQEMTEDRMAPEVLRTAYPRRDLHTIYFGEIMTCYRIDEQ